MWNDILSLIWIFMPVWLANTGPVIANNIPMLERYNKPLDFQKTWRGKRLLGDNKTIRGLAAGMVVGMVTAALQMFAVFINPNLENYSYSVVDYTSWITLIIGLVMGFGALAGDSIKSFFKRRFNIPPGKSWVPFDQLDFVIGGTAVSTLFFVLPTQLYILMLLIALVAHPAVNIISWLLRLQDKPY
jgi:CDP-2,3-bis-(O-geranylgeranyl)-sn-glycerol synthase